MPMFPDGGVPANEAINTLPDVNTVVPGDELWYSTSRCDPRFDPPAANAMLAENMNLIMKAELQYDSATLTHLERAVRYLIQRGLPRACVLAGGPFDYTSALDPGITRHNDLMTLTILPNINNQAAATLNLGLGPVPILRNDGLPLESQDLKSGKPAIIVYWGGAWYVCGLAASQVPLSAIGAVDGWIRTDGNDTTGDGTANTPDKAFRTIQGAWNTIGGRYAASPLFSINLRLGIPGDYEYATLGPYGGYVSVTGDPNDRFAYRIVSATTGGGPGGAVWALRISGVGGMNINGVNLVMRCGETLANGNMCLRAENSSIWLFNLAMTLEASSPTATMWYMMGGGCACAPGDFVFEGNSYTCSSGFAINSGGHFGGCPPGGALANWTWRNIYFSGSGFAFHDMAVCNIGNMTITNAATVGVRYDVQTNAVLYRGGWEPPGDQPGTVGSQGQVF